MACKKTSYKTEDAARRALHKILENPRDPLHVPTSTYYCHGCKGWHLTKMMQKFTPKNPRRKNR